MLQGIDALSSPTQSEAIDSNQYSLGYLGYLMECSSSWSFSALLSVL